MVGVYQFKRSHRLLKPEQFKPIFQSGKRLKRNGFTFIVKENGLDHPRLGLTIAKRHVRRAIDRNFLKRRIRESFRLTQNQLGGVDIIVMVNHSVTQHTPNQLWETIGFLWGRLTNR